MRYFTPANVKVRKSHRFGGLLETADNRTLYVRELGGDGADSPLRGARGSESTGMRIGLTGCVADCDATWRPFLAADDDEPSGYWSIYDRADGKKQWAYFGYALYIYVDEPAGKTYGHMTYDDIDDFELLPDNRSRDLLRLRWRVAPP